MVLAVELAFRAVDRLWLAQRKDALGRPAVSRLVRDLGSLLGVFAAAVFAAHAFLDVPYARFLLPSAVVSAVLGFALQDVLKNVFAGLSLQTEVPFLAGDWILLDGEPMQVLEVTLHATRLRTSLGVQVREPNATLVGSRIANLGSGQRSVGFAVEVGVAYGSPPGLVKASLELAARRTRRRLRAAAARRPAQGLRRLGGALRAALLDQRGVPPGGDQGGGAHPRLVPAPARRLEDPVSHPHGADGAGAGGRA